MTGIRLAVCGQRVDVWFKAGLVLGSQWSVPSHGTVLRHVVEGVPAESRLSGDGNTFWQQPAHLVQVSQRRSLENVERRLLHKSIKQGAQTEKREAGEKNATA